MVLAFIGVKLLTEALHGSGRPHRAGSRAQVGAWLSLTIIALVLGVTALAGAGQPAAGQAAGTDRPRGLRRAALIRDPR